MTDTATRMLENARRNFATNGAVWDDRTEAAVRSLIGAFVLDIGHVTMPPEVVRGLRHALDTAADFSPPVPGSERDGAETWVNQRYDHIGKRIDD